MANLLNLPVYQKGQKRKSAHRRVVSCLVPLAVLAELKGSEREYLDWLRTQPSAFSGRFSWDEGTPFCEPAHWRTAKHSGTGQKPVFLAIPLTHAEHALQHQKGQSVIGARDWWERQCIDHLQRWLAS